MKAQLESSEQINKISRKADHKREGKLFLQNCLLLRLGRQLESSESHLLFLHLDDCMLLSSVSVVMTTIRSFFGWYIREVVCATMRQMAKAYAVPINISQNTIYTIEQNEDVIRK